MSDKKDNMLTELQLELRKSLAEQFIAIRRDKGMTQVDISETTGILRPNISRMEKGDYNPTLDMIARIAYSLDKKIVISFEDIEK